MEFFFFNVGILYHKTKPGRNTTKKHWRVRVHTGKTLFCKRNIGKDMINGQTWNGKKPMNLVTKKEGDLGKRKPRAGQGVTRR